MGFRQKPEQDLYAFAMKERMKRAKSNVPKTQKTAKQLSPEVVQKTAGAIEGIQNVNSLVGQNKDLVESAEVSAMDEARKEDAGVAGIEPSFDPEKIEQVMADTKNREMEKTVIEKQQEKQIDAFMKGQDEETKRLQEQLERNKQAKQFQQWGNILYESMNQPTRLSQHLGISQSKPDTSKSLIPYDENIKSLEDQIRSREATRLKEEAMRKDLLKEQMKGSQDLRELKLKSLYAMYLEALKSGNKEDQIRLTKEMDRVNSSEYWKNKSNFQEGLNAQQMRLEEKKQQGRIEIEKLKQKQLMNKPLTKTEMDALSVYDGINTAHEYFTNAPKEKLATTMDLAQIELALIAGDTGLSLLNDKQKNIYHAQQRMINGILKRDSGTAVSAQEFKRHRGLVDLASDSPDLRSKKAEERVDMMNSAALGVRPGVIESKIQKKPMQAKSVNKKAIADKIRQSWQQEKK